MEKTAVKVQRYLIITSMLALAACAAGCISASAARPGTGGTPAGGTSAAGGTTAVGGTPVSGGTTTPTGGTTTAGGTTSAAGTTAAAGASGGTALACASGVSPAQPLLTDFSATATGWHAASGKWGATGNLTGSGFNYAKTGSTISWKVDTAAGNLVLYGDVLAPAGYGGGGMSFDQCVNTSTYTGVQFTLGGAVQGCNLKFELQTFDQQAIANGGGCDPNTSSCYGFPYTTLQSTTGPIVVKFADLAGTGQPATAAAIAQEIIGLQWQFESPAPVGDAGQPDCKGINLTIDDVSFVSN